MRTLITLGIAAAALSAIVLVVRGQRSPRAAAMPSVTVRDIPGVLAALSATARDGTFAVFLFGADGQAPAEMDALNVQFSIEGGRVGIDWVLLAPLNLESQSRFVAFFEREGQKVGAREMNQVKYLRVEGGQPAELLQGFLSSEFKVAPEQKMDLIAEGFVWAG
jgi:hypothetical protein